MTHGRRLRQLRRARYAALTLAAAYAVLMALVSLGTAMAASDDEWQIGVNIRPSSGTDLAEAPFRASMRDLRETGANFVTILIPLVQEDARTTEVSAGPSTPDDRALAEGIKHIHSLGMEVNLKLHLTPEGDTWRARIDPVDRGAWFDSYGGFLDHYAELAEANGVAMITVGSEIINMTSALVDETNTEHWLQLIASMRERYSGSLTYSANWGGSEWAGEAHDVEFWDALDYIGISAFYEFGPPFDLPSLMEQWDRWSREEILPLHQKWDRPVIFTEVGYRSSEEALAAPWAWGSARKVDHDQQAVGYEALFSYWRDVPWMRGVHLWEWMIEPKSLPDHESGYSPQGKPALEVMRQWFATGAAPDEAPPWASSLDHVAGAPGATTFVVCPSSAGDTGGCDFVGDGANDHEMIMAAINALPEGGGRVNLAGGLFWINGNIEVNDKENIVLSGNGPSTVLRFVPEATLDRSGMIRPHGTTNIVVEYMVLDGNKEEQTDPERKYGFYSEYTENVTLRGLTVKNFPMYGIDPHAPNTRQVWILDSIVKNNGTPDHAFDGITLDGVASAVVRGNITEGNARHGINVVTNSRNVIISDNIVRDNGASGIMVQNGSTRISITGNQIIFNGQDGIFLNAVHSNLVSGNLVEGNGSHGVQIIGAHNTVTSNLFRNNGQSAGSGHAHVLLKNDGATFATGNTVTGNTIIAEGETGARYGVNEYSPDDTGNFIANNLIEGPFEVAVRTQGPTTITDAPARSGWDVPPMTQLAYIGAPVTGVVVAFGALFFLMQRARRAFDLSPENA